MFKHPWFLVGFRPFFTFAFAAGVLLPLLWALSYTRMIPPEATGLDPIAWHAHEMLFGFGWAVLGGFLLTASKNWVNVRGMHGGLLAFAAALWLIERGAVLLPATGTLTPVRWVLVNGCVALVGGYVVYTLARYRAQDTFKDNTFFLAGLPVLLVAKNLLLHPATWTAGVAMSLGIFRLAFAVMFERTITQFMRNALGVALPRYRWLDHSIKVLVLLSAFEALLPPAIAAATLAAAGTLLFLRLLTWKPLEGLRTFGIAIMYAGYTGLVIHFWLNAARYQGLYVGIGSLATHAFTLLTMGVIIPGMLIRISQGHTGRKLLFTWTDKAAFAAMAAAAFFRLVATQVWPAHYRLWIVIAAISWSLCFLVIGARVVPFLFRPRIDGREH